MGMSTKTQSELSKFFGPVVGTGAERICVRNLNNEFSCFKISKKIHSKETRREINVNFQRFSTPYPEVA